MAVRADVSVDWTVSPRIITVLSPSIAISIQDLHDTLTTLESRFDGMDEPRIISSGGKEFLDATTSVGITTTLQNAKLAFQARGGPAFVQCSVAGGNLVAVDDTFPVPVPIDPIQTTAFTQIVRTSSASATLQDLDTIQAASFGTQTSVAIDVVNGTSGTEFPQGTREFPVDDADDALTIATTRGIHDILVVSSMTLGAAEDFSAGYRFFSDNPERVMITVSSSADVSNCVFENIGVAGDMDMDVIMNGCHVGNITSFTTGEFHECTLQGTVTLSGIDGDVVSFVNCTSGVAGATHSSFPVLDIAGTAEEVMVRNYSGGLGIVNNTDATNEMAFDFNSGRLDLAASNTAGTFHVYGLVTIADSSTGTTTVLDHTVDAITGFTRKLLRNKTVTDPVTGLMTVYDDDDTTVLASGQLFEDASETQTYRGQGAEVRERLT